VPQGSPRTGCGEVDAMSGAATHCPRDRHRVSYRVRRGGRDVRYRRSRRSLARSSTRTWCGEVDAMSDRALVTITQSVAHLVPGAERWTRCQTRLPRGRTVSCRLVPGAERWTRCQVPLHSPGSAGATRTGCGEVDAMPVLGPKMVSGVIVLALGAER